MIKTHQQQMELRLPRIGVVRKGGAMTRGATASGNRPGRDLSYFRLDRADRAVVEAWNATFGPEPSRISGIMPYAAPEENLSIWDELWEGVRLVWRGDGERLHIQRNGDAYVRYAPGEGPAQPAAAGSKVGKGKVARMSRLRLLLPQLRIAGIFEFLSSSAIDADELWANLMWIKSTVATLQGAPVTVFRAARQFNIPNPKGEGTMAVEKHMLHMMLDGAYLDRLLPVAGALPAPSAPVALPATIAATVEDGPDEGEWEEDDAPPAPGKATPADPLHTFLFLAEQRPGAQAVAFANGRLSAWVNYVTDNKFDPAQAEFLNQVLDRYCSAVADNDNTHTKAAAEKARADYVGGLAALALPAQDDLFGAEYDDRQTVVKAALESAQGKLN